MDGCGLLHRVLDVKRCQEYEDVRLNQSVEYIKIETEDGRNSDRNYHLDELHDDKCAEDVTEKSHAQGQRTNHQLEDVDRCDDRNRL